MDSHEFSAIATPGTPLAPRRKQRAQVDCTGPGAPIGQATLCVELEKFKLAVESTNNMVVITDAQKRIEYVNPAFSRVTGWTIEEVRGRKAGSFLHGPKTNQQVVRAINRSLKTAEAVQGAELLNYSKSGQSYWVSLNIQPIRDATACVTHFVSVQIDITDKRATEDQLRASERRLGEAQLVARMGSYEYDLSTDTLIWSAEVYRLLDQPVAPHSLTLAQFADRVHPADRLKVLQTYWAAPTQQSAYEVEYRYESKHGACHWLRERGQYLPPDETAPARLSGVLIDVTVSRASQDRLNYLVRHDPLTGLANRDQLQRALADAMDHTQHHGGVLPLIVIGLDRFKLINDSLGHHVGDEVLVEVGRRLRGCVRGSDIVARPSGDEFVIVLVAVRDADSIGRVCRKILARLGEPLLAHGKELHISASLGVSLYPGEAETADQLLSNADAAMHQAKQHGGHTACWYAPEFHARSRDRFERESLLRLALPRNELLLHYQPQIQAATGELVGFEALLRWKCRERGLVAPDDFIPLAEETGLILAIGNWVIEQACRQWTIWQTQHRRSLRVSVNLSANQLRDHGLVERIAGLMAQYGVPAGVLELELTESVAMQDPAASIQTMRRLSEIGVSLAVDDFGTGYSSLSYLKMLPIQRLKLDRSFVKDIETDADDRAICTATIVLAHSLGLEVVAEGVESQEQNDFLVSLGCDILQGYLFGKPLPLEQATQFIARFTSLKFTAL